MFDRLHLTAPIAKTALDTTFIDTYNKALTARLRRIVALRQLERGEVVVRGWEELFMELGAVGTPVAPANPETGSARPLPDNGVVGIQ